MSTTTTAATRGRPRSFDRDAVLDALIQLFWEKGYEATSMSDIVQTTNLNKSSLYNTFGPKDQVFKEALERYVDLRAARLSIALIDGEEGLADIHSLFDLLWHEFHENGDHRGCLAVNSSTELGLRDPNVVSAMLRYRTSISAAFRSALTRAADNGEIAPQLVETYVTLSVTSMLGMAVLARSGASSDEVLAQLNAARYLVDSWKIT